MKNTAKPGDTVELKDKETGFFDTETNFQVVRDQQAKLGDSIGRRTNEALLSGGLLIVNSKADKPKVTNELPEDFPGREFFAGRTAADVAKMTDEDLLKIDGIGQKTLEAIRGYKK